MVHLSLDVFKHRSDIIGRFFFSFKISRKIRVVVGFLFSVSLVAANFYCVTKYILFISKLRHIEIFQVWRNLKKKNAQKNPQKSTKISIDRWLKVIRFKCSKESIQQS